MVWKDKKEHVCIWSTVTKAFVWSAWLMRESGKTAQSENLRVNPHQLLPTSAVTCCLPAATCAWHHRGREGCWEGTCRAQRHLPRLDVFPRNSLFAPQIRGTQVYSFLKQMPKLQTSFLPWRLTYPNMFGHSFNFSNIFVPEESPVRRK